MNTPRVDPSEEVMTDQQAVWLRPNRRLLLFAACVALLLGIVGIVLIITSVGSPAHLFRSSSPGLPLSGWVGVVGWVGVAVTLLAGCLLVGISYQISRPRVAYSGGELFFFLRYGQPVIVPVDVVEAFFLGQGPQMQALSVPDLLPTREAPEQADERPHECEAHETSSLSKLQSVHLVARIAERATEWHQVDLSASLGRWEDGYITLYGSWTEPLNVDVVKRLNRQLKAVRAPNPLQSRREVQ